MENGTMLFTQLGCSVINKGFTEEHLEQLYKFTGVFYIDDTFVGKKGVKIKEEQLETFILNCIKSGYQVKGEEVFTNEKGYVSGHGGYRYQINTGNGILITVETLRKSKVDTYEQTRTNTFILQTTLCKVIQYEQQSIVVDEYGNVNIFVFEGC